MINKMPVSLIWEAVFHPPEGMEEWQAYRIEYAGHAEQCVAEGLIWLPPDVSPDWIEEILSGRARRDALQKLVEEAQSDGYYG